MIRGSRESSLPQASRVIIELYILTSFPLLSDGYCNVFLVLHRRVKQLKDQSSAYDTLGSVLLFVNLVEFEDTCSETDLNMLCPVSAFLCN